MGANCQRSRQARGPVKVASGFSRWSSILGRRSGPGERAAVRQGSTPAAVKPAHTKTSLGHPAARSAAPQHAGRRGREAGAGLLSLCPMSLSAGAPWRRARPGGRGSARRWPTGSRRACANQGMAVDVGLRRGGRDWRPPGSPGTTWWCSTGTCRASTATRCAPAWSRGAAARILMLTAAAAVEDRVDGLNLGADDYLGQAVRVRRARRPGAGAGPAQPGRAARGHRGDLAVDRARRRVSRAGRPSR